MPGRIEVWYQGLKTEVRMLEGLDGQGRASYQVQSLGLVPSRLFKAVPVALRPLLPPWLRATPGVALQQIDTREPDGLLYCRELTGPGNIQERTYYDVGRERAVFAATGQNIEIPLRTYHAVDGEPVSPEPIGRRPFVYYAVVHDSPDDAVVDHLASYAVNVESTYDVGPHELMALSKWAAARGSWTITAAAGWLCAEYSRQAAPQPNEVRELVASLGLRAPFWRRFRWERRLHLLGPAGQHNQRLASVSELSEVEVETESSLVQHVHEPKRDGPGLVGARETMRRFIPKTPDGRFYVMTPQGRVVVSDPSTRKVPSGCVERRLSEPNAAGAGAGPLARIVSTFEGRAETQLDAEGLLPVTLESISAQVARVVREDPFERAAALVEFLEKQAPGGAAQGHVDQEVDPGAWYWHPQRRQWYPKAIARYTNGVLDERRELVYVQGVPLIEPLDGRATYRVQSYYRGDIRSPRLDRSGLLARLVDFLDQLEPMASYDHPVRSVLDGLRTLVAVAGLRPVEPYELVIEPDGLIFERRDRLVTVMDVALAREFLARSQYQCVIPAVAYERLPSGGRGEPIARFSAELASEGRFLTITRTSTLSHEWAQSIYVRDPTGVQDAFGRWAHWRLVSELTGHRPGVAAFRTLVFYKGDENEKRKPSLLPETSREIEGFLKREDEMRRGRGYKPPDAGEIGRVVFDAPQQAASRPCSTSTFSESGPTTGPAGPHRSSPRPCTTGQERSHLCD